ncbi:hypothetical protein [Clostridium fessum]|uniref:hypothetical protein n=1 Tax=Clostridium fessum TaxID=2126740 RepID=UPI0022DF6F4C|nr:hypothetical protein [Clostridium fessum]
MKKLITLLRLRQEGFQTESYDNDFIIDIPENLVDGTTLCTNDILKYCEKQLRKAARATIIGPDCEKIITETCDDYNWGDFILHATKEILATVGILCVNDYDGLIDKSTISPRFTVEVNQDEVLLPDYVEGVLIVRDPEEGDIRIDADANLSTGVVTIEKQDEDSIAEKMKDGREMFIDFGNGVEHPVAISEEQQEEADDTFFYLEQE